MPVTRKTAQWLGMISPLLFLWSENANAASDWGLNMTQGVTPLSHDIYSLHMMALWVCVVIGIGVFGVMFWSILMHRKSRGAVASQFSHNTVAEVVWTIIPICILVGMAIPATKVLIKLEDTSHTAMTIKVTGYQWKWQYEYLGKGIKFFSVLAQDSEKASQLDSGINPDTVPHYLRNVDKPLVLPIHTRIKILTTGGDVIHSWWVPAMGWKRDAIPGFVNASWVNIEKPGIYRGQCAELCGKGHAFMPIVVKAVPKEQFAAWVKEQQAAAKQEAEGANKTWSKDELMAKGKQVFMTICSACHQPNGLGIPESFPPIAAGHPFSAPQAMLNDLTERGFYKDGKIVEGPLDKHIDIVVNGITGTAMQAFGKQLDDVQIAAVITFERNSFGNETGDVVQPADIAKAKGK